MTLHREDAEYLRGKAAELRKLAVDYELLVCGKLLALADELEEKAEEVAERPRLQVVK
jgi:hypothetical protein